MNFRGNGTMSRFSVDVELASNEDLVLVHLGMLPPEKVRRVHLPGVVDTGATDLIVPESVVEQLGLPRIGTVRIRYADDRVIVRPKVTNVWLQLQGREGLFNATMEPDRTTVLLGAIVLEELDFLVDCKNQQLVPRDPETLTAEA